MAEVSATGIKKNQRPNRYYEGVIILHPDVKEADQKAFFQRNAETIKNYSGSVNHLDTWGRRRLANPINKMRLGSYFHITFEANSECVTELERTMKIDDRVLRYMHTRLDERVSLTKHLEAFKNGLAEAAKREQEREAKRDLRRRESRDGGGGRDFGGPREGGGRDFGGGRDGGGGRGGRRFRDDGDGDMDQE